MLPRLRPASFRGVPFGVMGDEYETGRRVVVREYPFREQSSARDLGKKAESFSVEAFVIGDDYADQRDALLDALVNTAGPGELIHPRYGRRLLQVGSVSTSHTPNDGGVTKFRITFHEVDDEQDGTGVVENLRQKLAEAVDRIDGLSASVFGDAFAAASTVTEFSTVLVDGVGDIMGAVLAPGVSGIGAVTSFSQGVADIRAQARGLVSRPSDLATRLQNLFRQTRSGGGFATLRNLQKAARLLAALLRPLAGTPGTVPADTEARVAGSLQLLTLGSLATSAADVAGKLTFDSIDSALEVRESVAAQIRELESLAHVFEGQLSREYRDLRIRVARAVPPRGSNLSSIERYTMDADLPSLVVAYQLYGDLDRELDLVRRNNIRNPGLIPFGRELAVLR